MSEQSDSDFERACAAYWAALRFNDGWKWSAVCERNLPVAGEVRRGLLAALRQLREPGEAQTKAGAEEMDPTWGYMDASIADQWAKLSWQAMLDELIRQGEQETEGG